MVDKLKNAAYEIVRKNRKESTMKKKLVMLLLCGVMACSFTACGNGDSKGTEISEVSSKTDGKRSGEYKIDVTKQVTSLAEYNGIKLDMDSSLEVTEDAITLSSPKPSYELDEFNIIKMPESSSGKFVFNATFANKSKINRTVVLVPVINHYENGVKVKSEVKAEAAVTTMLLDANNIIVTFTIPNAIAQSGTYTVSFEYLFDDEQDEESAAIDPSKLKSIVGESAPFDVEITPEDSDGYDYSFSIELVGQESNEEYETAILRTTVGADISEYRFMVTDNTNEEALEKLADDIFSGKCEEYYRMKESAEIRINFEEAGIYGVVVVLYGVDGEPLDDYYVQIFTLTTGIEDVEDNESEIHFDTNNNVVSVAEAGVIELFDASGKLIREVNGNYVSIADFEDGIYIVRYNENVVKVVKVVKR